MHSGVKISRHLLQTVGHCGCELLEAIKRQSRIHISEPLYMIALGMGVASPYHLRRIRL